MKGLNAVIQDARVTSELLYLVVYADGDDTPITMTLNNYGAAKLGFILPGQTLDTASVAFLKNRPLHLPYLFHDDAHEVIVKKFEEFLETLETQMHEFGSVLPSHFVNGIGGKVSKFLESIRTENLQKVRYGKPASPEERILIAIRIFISDVFTYWSEDVYSAFEKKNGAPIQIKKKSKLIGEGKKFLQFHDLITEVNRALMEFISWLETLAVYFLQQFQHRIEFILPSLPQYKNSLPVGCLQSKDEIYYSNRTTRTTLGSGQYYVLWLDEICYRIDDKLTKGRLRTIRGPLENEL